MRFEAEIKLTSCSNSDTSKRFFIKPHDLADSIEIEVETQCDCSCGDEEENSALCSGAGTYRCGMCHCNEGVTGETCQCDSQSVQSQSSCIK